MTNSLPKIDAPGFSDSCTSTEGTPADASADSSVFGLQYHDPSSLGIFFDHLPSALGMSCGDNSSAIAFATMTEKGERDFGEAFQVSSDADVGTTNEKEEDFEAPGELHESCATPSEQLQAEQSHPDHVEISESPKPSGSATEGAPGELSPVQEEKAATFSQQDVQSEKNAPTSSPVPYTYRPHQMRPALPLHSHSTSEIQQLSNAPKYTSSLRHGVVNGNVPSAVHSQTQHSTFVPQVNRVRCMGHRINAHTSSHHLNMVQNPTAQYSPLPDCQKYVKQGSFQQQQAGQFNPDASGAFPQYYGQQGTRFTGHGNTPALTNTSNVNNLSSQHAVPHNTYTDYMNRSMNNSLSGPSAPSDSTLYPIPMSYSYPYPSQSVYLAHELAYPTKYLSPAYAPFSMSHTHSSSDSESVENLKHEIYELRPEDKSPFTQQERRWYADLQASMCDMRSATDNDGMKRTWNSLMKQTNRLKTTCRNLIYVCRKAQRTEGPLQNQVKPINHFETMGERIEGICKALREQKTMCKHLMENPYIFQVVDDPIQASHRITNNRRVNKQKRDAIDAGRKAMSGHPSRKPVKEESSGDDDECFDAGEDAEGDLDSEPGSAVGGRIHNGSPAPNQIVRRERSYENKRPRKVRPQQRSIYQVQDNVLRDTASIPTSAPRAATYSYGPEALNEGYQAASYTQRQMIDYEQRSMPSDADDDGNDDGDWRPQGPSGQSAQPGQKRSRRGYYC